MASTRQRAANRANALRSTGPKTAQGRRRASLNATRHGLSTPTAPCTLGPEAQRVAELIALEGFGPAQSRELAALVVDYERALAWQREAYAPGPPAHVSLERIERDQPEVSMLIDDLHWKLYTGVRVGPRMLRGHLGLINRLLANWQRRQPRTAPPRPAALKRHLARAANRLTRALRVLGGPPGA